LRAAASATFAIRAARVPGRWATAIQPSSIFRADTPGSPLAAYWTVMVAVIAEWMAQW
jgi:hypothetical protein